jgi:hypothetical protein
MSVDLSSLPGWVVVTLFVFMVIAGAAARPSIVALIERVGRTRSTIKIVREQRRMANLALRSDIELSHSLAKGPKLIIRHSRRPAATNPEREER